jgi:hypothetical protein
LVFVNLIIAVRGSFFYNILVHPFETMWGRALSAKDVDRKGSQDKPKRDKNREEKSTQYSDIIGPGTGCEQTLFISNQGIDL